MRYWRPLSSAPSTSHLTVYLTKHPLLRNDMFTTIHCRSQESALEPYFQLSRYAHRFEWMWVNWRGVLTEGIGSTKKQLEQARDMGEIHIPEELLSGVAGSTIVRRNGATGEDNDEGSEDLGEDDERVLHDMDELSALLVGKSKDQVEEDNDLDDDPNERPEHRCVCFTLVPSSFCLIILHPFFVEPLAHQSLQTVILGHGEAYSRVQCLHRKVF